MGCLPLVSSLFVMITYLLAPMNGSATIFPVMHGWLSTTPEHSFSGSNMSAADLSKSMTSTQLINSDLDSQTLAVLEKYKGRLKYCCVAEFPNCDIFLCGTLHVAKTSADMVKDVIHEITPQYIVLELCEARIDNLLQEQPDDMATMTIFQVFREAYKSRSFRVFGMGLLTWMQLKAAKIAGNKLGGELTMAAREGMEQGATVILGDRLYGVTIQRVFDKLKFTEKLKMCFVLFWEVLTMSFFKLKEYIQKSEDQAGFIEDEIARFGKHLPSFAKVLIEERDEYLAQTIYEIARVVGGLRGGMGMRTQRYVDRFGTTRYGVPSKPRVLAVVGAGHLAGIQVRLG